MKLQWLENNQLIKNKYIKAPHVLFQQSKKYRKSNILTLLENPEITFDIFLQLDL